ncbi:MAG: endonuclease [Bacteroidaceae bacterium]|nr:endonuclease [Bacteroidaceae bacterium]
MKRLFTQLFMLLLAVAAVAQSEYYTSIDGTKGGATLKTALYNLIKNHQKISYGSGTSSTWSAFYTTDAVVENGQRRVLDMYSSEKRYFTSKGKAVSGMNIEHSVAKSWWGGTENNAYCDLHHLNPSDQTANSRKSNFPLGELTSVDWDNGVTFVGKANIDGSSQNAYEPCDEYKGDFARVFMYMFTCYQDLTWKYTWMNYEKSTYPTLKPWAVKLLLKWHKQDPVSEKEVNRNNAVHKIQGNRNPYVDYPQLADYVWGDSVNYTFHINGEVEDGTGSGDDNTKIEVPEGYYLKMFEDFEQEKLNFTPINVTGEFPWLFEYQCAEVTSYDDDGVPHDAESWLVSSPIDFSDDNNAKLTFDYVIRYCATDKVKEYNQLLISRDFNGSIADAQWETIDFDAAQNTEDWTKTTTGEIVIPASYMGDKAVVLAFKYIGTAAQAGTFEVDNVKLIAAEGENDGNTENGEDEGGDEGGSTGGEGNNGNFTDGAFTLVTDAAQLTLGDTILIAYDKYVMGASAGNYRYKTDFLTSNGKVTYLADDAQKILLEEGAVEGTFAFNVGEGYLAAKSSSSNHVTTATELDANGSWKIEIGSEALAVIKSQGDKTRNTLQYNTGSPRFSCYTGTQKSVNIYAKSPVSTGIEDNVAEEDNVNVYSLTGILLRNDVTREGAVGGLQPGIYIISGKKVLVR